MSVKFVRLDEVAETSSGGTPNRGNKKFYNGEIPWIKSGELPDGDILSVEEKITKEAIELSSAKLLQPGTLLIAMYGATVGKLGVLTFPAATNQAVCAIHPKEELDRDYLFYYLLRKRTALIAASFGGAQPNISQNTIRNLIIPLPSKKIQQKLASDLKGQLSEIENAKEATLKTKQDLQTFSNKQQQSALEKLDELDRVPLSEYLEGIEAGKSIKTTELKAKKDELGVLKVSAVSWDRFQPDEAKSVFTGYIPPDAHRVKKGDLIISRANTLELVGAVVLVEDDYPNRLLSDKTLRLITKSDILPEYLLYILKLPEARKHIEENATGTSNSMRNISQKTIYTIPIPQADEDQQREIIELMQLTRTELKKCEAVMKLMLADLCLLPNKLLQETFNKIEND